MSNDKNNTPAHHPHHDSHRLSAEPDAPHVDLSLSRRGLLKAGAATAIVAAVPSTTAFGASEPQVTPPPEISPLTLNVNGEVRQLEVDTRTTLLDALREHLHLTGTKKGCDHGQCGACTVMVNGRRINSCLTLAVMHQDDRITTIEGFGNPDKLHPVQAAFIKHDGYQCGYCTPGQICSTIAVLEELKAGIPSHVTADLTSSPPVSDSEIRERMSGNICRCGAYSNILAAINDVAGSEHS
ncbi:aldehyde dehydrogenase iron-sulfur subunit PaoA [Nissabacter sp. SGAir0207]|uniref:aldehyde dehydrogenase iron-sulfur subunit PaoA n=1 Tax=Nissabacter sp. SGAir0207 TaxID=2126321 RepID=UPI0010CD322C|nr:aldehyde dehydrogenase iron-sulfur subunit PaoA [Nissabacter sp. SGAir0207]QCR38087.1 aldehyde dehydrogenase iron-sulfur subunit [Nissabacter sp. SGAir0207]